MTIFWTLFVAILLCGSSSRGSELSTLAKGLASQCALSFARLLPSFKSAEVKELDLLLSQFKYRRNVSMTVNQHQIDGFIDRNFVEENHLSFDGKTIPPNHMTFAVVKRDRTSGIKEIAKGIAFAESERSWVFIPSKNIWVDTTISVADRDVYSDPVLIQALKEKYGAIEIFHSHPPATTKPVVAERKWPFSYLISGALPTEADLMQLVKLSWNTDRSKPTICGVIHPLGVTYYSSTRSLLASDAGPPIVDIGTLHTLYDSNQSAYDAVHNFSQLMVDRNRIKKFDGEPDPTAFNIKFFAIDDLDRAAKWLKENVESLSAEETAQNSRK